MYLITYILVPAVAGVLALLGWFGAVARCAGAPRPASRRALVGTLLLASAVAIGLDLADVMRALNPVGWLLFAAVLTSQLGLAALAIVEWAAARGLPPAGSNAGCRARLGQAERWLGALAVATAIAMALVRGQIFITIF